MAEATKEIKRDSTEASSDERFGEIKGFFSGSFAELKKVKWPDRSQVLTYTSVVLVTVFVVAALIYVMDFGLSQVMGYLLK